MGKNTTVQFYRGLRTIGGTIVSIEHKKARVIFDFGIQYEPDKQFFDGQILQRQRKIVPDYLRFHMIPPIQGLYGQKDLLGVSDIRSAEEYEGETAVIISHLHLDHMACIGLIAPSIPVYMSEESYKLLQILQQIGEDTQGHRMYQTCQYEQTFAVGEIRITPIRLDHDVLGACGYHIETPDGKIVYTGDYRFHGAHPEWTDGFVEKVKVMGNDVLITEGVMVSFEDTEDLEIVGTRQMQEDMLQETQIGELTAKKLQETPGVGIFNVYHRNIDRLWQFMKAAGIGKRDIVLEPETAAIILELTDNREMQVYISEETKWEIRENNMPLWKQRVLELCKRITAEQIHRNPTQYLVQNSYKNSLELLDFPAEKAVYIHSNGVPLGTFDPAYENLRRLLDMLGIAYIWIGSGGHASAAHLKYLIDAIDPKVLIPLHSFHPERLLPNTGYQLLPETGKKYVLEKGSLR